MTPLGPPGEDGLPPRALCPYCIVHLRRDQATACERLPAVVGRKDREKTGKMLRKGKLYRSEGNGEGDSAEMLWA